MRRVVRTAYSRMRMNHNSLWWIGWSVASCLSESRLWGVTGKARIRFPMLRHSHAARGDSQPMPDFRRHVLLYVPDSVLYGCHARRGLAPQCLPSPVPIVPPYFWDMHNQCYWYWNPVIRPSVRYCWLIRALTFQHNRRRNSVHRGCAGIQFQSAHCLPEQTSLSRFSVRWSWYLSYRRRMRRP